jgi:peptide/nickel transport system substrate-binding protein
MEGADVLAPNQFRLRFKQPFGMVLDALAKPSTSAAFIMPKRIAVTSADKQIEDATGSGPFIFKQDEYRPGERVVYLKNPAYKPRAEPASGLAGGKRVYVDRVEWIVLKDVQTQVNALATGQVDIIEALPAEHFASLRADPNTKVVFPIPAGPAIILFNHLVPPFDNPKVRQAALLAINQEAMLRAQANDKALYQVCVSIYPCSSPLASTLSSGITGKPQFEKAKALLKEAGYDGTPVVLLHPADLAIIAKLPVVYAQLLRQAGFKVDMQTMDWATLQSRRAMKTTTGPGGWSAFISRVGAADALNPLFIPYLSGIGEKGFFGWPTNPKSEQMKIDYVAATTPEARLRIAHAMQQEVYDSAMFGPVGDLAFPSATRSNISGVLSASANVFWNIRKD